MLSSTSVASDILKSVHKIFKCKIKLKIIHDEVLSYVNLAFLKIFPCYEHHPHERLNFNERIAAWSREPKWTNSSSATYRIATGQRTFVFGNSDSD